MLRRAFLRDMLLRYALMRCMSLDFATRIFRCKCTRMLSNAVIHTCVHTYVNMPMP